MRRSSRFAVSALLFLAGLALSPAASSACNSVSIVNRGVSSDLTSELGDYGLIFQDATNAPCADSAYHALLAKVTATLASGQHMDGKQRMVGPYQGWLEGAEVGLIFGAALELGGQGVLHADLDAALEQIPYASNPTLYGLDPGCGFDNGRWIMADTCMDDYVTGAAAFAWMAAYEHLRGRSSASGLAAKAQTAIGQTLLPSPNSTSICLYNAGGAIDASRRGPCNGSIAELQAGTAEIVSLNHGYQNIGYGLGLMTSLSSAFLGLEQAGAPASLTADEKTIAMALLDEGQRKSTSNGSAFKMDCYLFTSPGGGFLASRTADCGDSGFHYLPKMFPVKTFYARNNFGTPKTTVVDNNVSQAAYAFDTFDPSLFKTSPTSEFFNAARRVVYGDLTLYWYSAKPPLSGKLNDFSPIGFLDGINASGCASGWACDQDTPTTSIRVDFYVDGFTTYIQSALANLGSEAAVNSMCGGGTAHRFVSCLPAGTKGLSIYAYGVDSSGVRGWGNLPGWQCANDPACVW